VVYAEQPLIVTDWPIGKALFPFAVHVRNEADSIADGVRRMRDGLSQYVEVAAQARDLQLQRWEGQLNSLRSLLGLPSGARGGNDQASTGLEVSRG
jgi:hypothetical protein